MSLILREYVDDSGSLRNESCITPFANIMKEERNYVRQNLLLRVASSSNPDILSSFVNNELFLNVLQNWLVESVENSNQLVVKILEFLDRLHFSVEMLKNYKFGKIIKKLSASEKKG